MGVRIWWCSSIRGGFRSARYTGTLPRGRKYWSPGLQVSFKRREYDLEMCERRMKPPSQGGGSWNGAKETSSIQVCRTNNADHLHASSSTDAQHRPEASPSAAFNGDRDAKSPANQITNSMRMTMEEACLILNVKKEDPVDEIEKVSSWTFFRCAVMVSPLTILSFSLQHYETIFKANAPAVPPAGTKKTPNGGSHYLQSKVFRALERIKAERELEAAGGAGAAEGEETATEAGKEEPVLSAESSAPPPPENEPIATGPPPPSSKSS